MYFLCCSIINLMWNLFDLLPSFGKSLCEVLKNSRFIGSLFDLLFSFFPFFLCTLLHLLGTFFDILFLLFCFGFHFLHSSFDVWFQFSCGLLNIFSSLFKARMCSDNIETFLWICWREWGIHTESFDNNFDVILMFVDVCFEVDFLDIAHIDFFIHRKRKVILKNFDFISKDSDSLIFIKTSFLRHFQQDLV